MTRDEVLSTGIKPEQIHALVAYLKCSIPRPPRMADPTALINNEGAMNGWINAADALATLAIPANQATPEQPGMYSEPPRKTV